MKYKLIKGLRHLHPRHTGLNAIKYNNLLSGQDVLLNEKEVENLESLGARLKPIEKKKKEEKINNG